MAEPETVPLVAVMVVLPAAKAVARPELLTVATDVFDELHVTVVVRFCVLPSLYVPVAVNCANLPCGTVALLGVTAIETNEAGLTVSMVLALMAPDEA